MKQKYRIVEYSKPITMARPYYTIEEYKSHFFGLIYKWVPIFEDHLTNQKPRINKFFSLADVEFHIDNLIIANAKWDRKIVKEYE